MWYPVHSKKWVFINLPPFNNLIVIRHCCLDGIQQNKVLIEVQTIVRLGSSDPEASGEEITQPNWVERKAGTSFVVSLDFLFHFASRQKKSPAAWAKRKIVHSLLRLIKNKLFIYYVTFGIRNTIDHDIKTIRNINFILHFNSASYKFNVIRIYPLMATHTKWTIINNVINQNSLWNNLRSQREIFFSLRQVCQLQTSCNSQI